MIVNGRISDRAFPKYRRFRALFSSVLELCDRILAQSDEMKTRFELVGACAESVEVSGNLKYDSVSNFDLSRSPAVSFVAADRNRPLWIAASTSADDRLVEEDFVIAAQQRLPGWRLIIAPRKPERFDEVAERLESSGLDWTRRSGTIDPAADVLLLDSVGELSGLFPFATAVFMGGTLADRGGHNILEPAICGKPIVTGPHLENFQEIAEDFRKQNALIGIDRGEDLR